MRLELRSFLFLSIKMILKARTTLATSKSNLPNCKRSVAVVRKHWTERKLRSYVRQWKSFYSFGRKVFRTFFLGKVLPCRERREEHAFIEE